VIFDMQATIAAAQTIIFFSVLIVLLPLGLRYWSRKDESREAFAALSWGFALAILSFWRSIAFVDVHFVGSGDSVLNTAGTLVVWVVVSAICFMGAVAWVRGKPTEEKE
jgi:hypothetical protein